MLSESLLEQGHDVLQLLRRRRAGLASEQGVKLGLVVEGGGMRTVVPAAMAMALSDAKMQACFDGIYASSGGALVAAYFVSRRSRMGTAMFIEDLTSSTFLNWVRTARGRPMMSMDYLFDEVVRHRKPLDLKAIRESNFHVIATNAHDAAPITLSPFDTDEEVLAGLRASCTIPMIAGEASAFRDGFFFDGGIRESVPFRAAVEDGCTHILALVARPWKGERARPSPFHHLMAARIRKRYGPMGDAFLERLASYPKDLAFLEAATQERKGTPSICAVAPHDVFVRVFERRRTVLRSAVDAGYAAMARAMLEHGILDGEFDRPAS